MGPIIPLLLLLSMPEGGIQEPSREKEACPVMPEEEIDPAIYADYRGKRVYFCCPGCRKRFLKAPSQYVKVPDLEPDLGASPEAPQDAEPPSKPDPLRYVGRFHPPMVHFPIALILAAAFAEFLFMMTGRPAFESASGFMTSMGAWTAVAAASLGWFSAIGAGYKGELEGVLSVHRWVGTATAAIATAAWVLSLLARRKQTRGLRWGFRATLLLASILVASAGFYGGLLVFGTDHFSW